MHDKQPMLDSVLAAAVWPFIMLSLFTEAGEMCFREHLIGCKSDKYIMNHHFCVHSLEKKRF